MAIDLETWKPPIITGIPAARSSQPAGRARNWLVCTPQARRRRAGRGGARRASAAHPLHLLVHRTARMSITELARAATSVSA
jgi:hypothetical protein